MVLTETLLTGGFFLGLVLGLGRLFKKDRSRVDLYLAALYSSLGILQLAIYNVKPSLEFRTGWLSEVDIPLLYLSGPLLYFIYRELMAVRVSRRQHLFHLGAPLAALVLLLPYFIKTQSEKELLFKLMFVHSEITLVSVVFALGLISAAAYTLYLSIRLAFIWGSGNRAARVLQVIMALAWCIFGLIVTGIISKDYNLILYAVSLIAGGMAMLFWVVQAYPGLFEDTRDNLEQSNASRRSLLSDEQISFLEERLGILINREHVFTQPDLNLSGLAAMLDVNRHQLSQYLNDRLGKNFNSYINEFRLKYARELIDNEKDRSAISVGFAAGFSSYATFQQRFRKEFGLSPARYRDRERP